MDTAIAVTFRPSLVNGWFIRSLARSFVSVDGVEREVGWGRNTIIDVQPGAVEVAVYFRYRGTRSSLGTGTCRLDLAPGATAHLVARNGILNQTPFTVSAAR